MDLQTQLDSQNISNITNLTTTSLRNDSPILFLGPKEPLNPTPTEQWNLNYCH